MGVSEHADRNLTRDRTAMEMQRATEVVRVPEEERLLVSLGHIGGALLSDTSVEVILRSVAEGTQTAVECADIVSVTMSRGKGLYTPVATGEVARKLDSVQYESKEGPCLEALSTGAVVNAVLEAKKSHWPAFVGAALAEEIRSMLSMPLQAREQRIGALNIYSRDDRTISERDLCTATVLARQASVVLANALAFSRVAGMNDQLHEAIRTRDMIGQAKGILMERQGCDPDTAFDMLRRASQRENRKLRDVAADLVRSTQHRRPGR